MTDNSPEYIDGMIAAQKEITSLKMNYEQILAVLELFVTNPPTTPFQRGYMQTFRQAAEEKTNAK